MTLDAIGPGRLKCVTAWSRDRPLRGIIERTLREHVRDEDLRALHGETFLVYTEAETEEIRDWLKPELNDGESAFVVEFEVWSGYGGAPDRRWLLRRGH